MGLERGDGYLIFILDGLDFFSPPNEFGPELKPLSPKISLGFEILGFGISSEWLWSPPKTLGKR